MLRILIFSFSCVWIACAATSQDAGAPAATAPESSEPSEPTMTAIAGTPEIDGKVDEAWKKAPAVEVKKVVADLLTIDEDDMATAKVRVLWDPDHIYALWQVKDGNLSAESSDMWSQDSVELFLDENFQRTAYYQSDDAQYRVSFEGALSGQGSGFDESNLKAVAKKTKKGYVVEMAIKIQGDKLEAGRKLGIELQVNDDPGSGERGAIAKWNHTKDDSWESTSDFGTLILK